MWYGIYCKKYSGSVLILQFLNWHDMRTPNKWQARTFYHEDDAISALAIMKRKDEQKSD